MTIKQTYKPIEPVNIGVNKDTINDFARKYNLEIERVYDILNKYKQRKVAFTAKGDYWNVTETGAILSVAHNGNIIYAVFSVADGVETQVVVGVKRDDTNVILEAEAPFDGYMLFLSDDSTRGVGGNLPEDAVPQVIEWSTVAQNAANDAKEQADRAIQGFPADNSITAFKLSPSLGQKSGVSANTANAMCECLMTYIAKSADGTFSYQQNNKAINYSISDETVVASQGIDCTTTMTMVIGGCPYEQSRYCAGNDKNHFKAMGYGYDFYEGKDYGSNKYSWLWQIANRLFEKGYYIPIQDEAGNINYKGLQPGDIIIWCNTSESDDSRIQPINFAKANNGQDLWAKHTDFVIGTCGNSVLVGDGGQIPIQVHEARKLSYCDYVFAFRVPLGEGVPTNINCKSIITNNNADNTENNGQLWSTTLAMSEILRYTPVAASATVEVTAANKTIQLYQGPNSSGGYSELLGNNASYTTTEADVGKTITVLLTGFTNIYNSNHSNMGIRVMSTKAGKLIKYTTSYPATYVDEARSEKRLYAATTEGNRLAPKRLLDMKTDGAYTVSTSGYLFGSTVGKCECLNSTHMLTKDYTRDIVWELIDNEWYPIDVKLKGVDSQLCPVRFKPPSGTICHFEFVAANLAFINTSGSSSTFSTFAQNAFKNSLYRKYEGYISDSALTMFATHIGGTDKTIYKVKYDFETSTWSLLA